MPKVKLKTLTEIGIEPIQAGKRDDPCAVFIQVGQAGIKRIIRGPKNGNKDQLVFSFGGYKAWSDPEVPVTPLLNTLDLLLDLTKQRPDIQLMMVHQLKAKLDAICEENPWPEDVPAPVEIDHGGQETN